MKDLKLNRWDMVYIQWEDSYHSSGWSGLDSLALDDTDSLEQISVGYFVYETGKTISIVQTARANNHLREQHDTHVDGALTIPKKAITAMCRLEPTNPRGQE